MNPRLKKFLNKLHSQSVDAFLVSSWPNVTYLSGFTGTESWILVSPKGLFFITDSRYGEQAKKEAKGFKVILRDKKSVPEIVLDLSRRCRAVKIGFETHIVTHSFYLGLEKALGKPRLAPTQGWVENLRVIKDKSEIERLRQSANIAVKGYHYVRQSARPSMKERELQARLEHFTKNLGAEKQAFDIIIASGAKSSMPHAITDGTPIRDNNLVLVDMGVVFEGYHSDLTRPFFLGRINAFQKRIYDIVWNAQRRGIQAARPGVLAKDVDAACRGYIQKKGYGDFFGHGTGHGVGLEIHEAPTISGRSETRLEPGMVITVEPGIYLPGRFGVRIEDMVLITKNGNEVLTRGLDE